MSLVDEKDWTMAGSVLVVEDEPKLRDLLRSYLEREGFQVYTSASGAEALTVARKSDFDVVLLDLGLPDIPGEEVARELRLRSDVPIIILTARSDERDRIAGLELGADDYLTKPFSPRELILRVQAILRRGRSTGEVQQMASFGNATLVIDEVRREVVVRGEPVDLTPTEWGILAAMAGHAGRVYSRYELINRARGYEFEGYERVIDSHIKNLRRKIEADPRKPALIRTVLGGGYRLDVTKDP
jgi:DNA-binding response OmpR family regulator